MSDASVKLMAALLAAAAVPPHYLFVAGDDAALKELVDAGWAEPNPSIVNPKAKKEVAVRLTETGTVEAGKPATTSGQATAPAFAIIDFTLPKIERKGGNKGGNKRKSKYPTDDLAPGQAFFIPIGPDVKSPSKTYGSIASGANKKYGSLEAGADFRFFGTRSIEDGKDFGPQHAGKPGIVIGRASQVDAMAQRDKLIANPPKPRAKKAAPATT